MTFWLKTLALIAVAIYLLVGVLQFLGSVRVTAMLLVASIFFAYLVYPLVRRLNERLPLLASLLVVYLVIIIVVAALAQWLVPPLASDIQNAARTLPGLIGHYSQVLQDPNNRLFSRLPPGERAYLASIPAQISAYLQTSALATAQKSIAVVLSTISVLTSLIIIPILTAYTLLESASLRASFLGLVPPRGRAKTEAIIDDLDRVVGGFIRGQLIDGAILAVMMTAMLSIMHVPYALLIGVLSGALNFIPYAGSVVAFIPAFGLALAYNGLSNAVIVGVLIAVINQIDGNFVAPRVLRDNVGLSPFWIVVSILAFSELFGLVGTFLAVPAAAMIRVLRDHLLPSPVTPRPRPEG